MGPALLCETVTGATTAELLAARDAAAAADMVELRLDGVADMDAARALQGRRLPVIVTCRPAWEGGRFDGSEDTRLGILRSALQSGADYVDVEWRALEDRDPFRRFVSDHRDRVVLSSHDFSGVPADLARRAEAMRSTGAAVIKIAVAVTRLSDTLPLLEIARGGNAVVIGMGDAGVPTRLLAARFGSRWTYGGGGVAPGQIPVIRMLDEFRFRDVGPETVVYGVVGDNVMHSLSPAMHNAAFAASRIDAVYVPLRAADFADFLTFADGLAIAGASVTIPFKIDALTAAASADELTRAVGAANTLRRHPSGWEATNTDVAGFLDPLDEALGRGRGGEHARGDSKLRAAILGAGGAARAAIVAMKSRGARVTVHARRDAAARDVAESLGVETGAWPPPRGSWDVLVNCTPLGGAAAPGSSPLPDGAFEGRLVYDLTYGPAESPLVRDARRAGCQAIDGLPMLVAQAERQFEWWTGSRPPMGVMRAAAEAATSRRHAATTV